MGGAPFSENRVKGLEEKGGRVGPGGEEGEGYDWDKLNKVNKLNLKRDTYNYF